MKVTITHSSGKVDKIEDVICVGIAYPDEDPQMCRHGFFYNKNCKPDRVVEASSNMLMAMILRLGWENFQKASLHAAFRTGHKPPVTKGTG